VAIASGAIRLEHVTKRYAKVVALNDLSLSVEHGVFGFLGPNGAGKTTAVKILLGLTRPTTGSGSLAGAAFGSKSSLGRIGYLPELFRYQSWLTAREVLALHCELAGIDRARWGSEIDRILATVGLADRGTSRVGTFSKGMQQRLGLGVALLDDPAVVLLDEPTSALDPVGRHDVREIIRALREKGTIVFLNSHLLSEVEQVCDAVAIVDRGKVVALNDLSLSVEHGVFGFLGPNGAGKTTAVKILLGLTRPTTGSGSLAGAAFGSKPSLGRIGYLPELFRYQSWLTGREVLALHCELAGIDRARWGSEIDRILATVGLADRGTSRVGTFSKGMQQRLGLGVALLDDPAVVLLDEPTSALDPVGRHDVREIIRALREKGTIVFLNSHLLSEVEQVCDAVAIVDRGKVVAQGGLAELLRTSSVRVRATGISREARAAMARFGELDDDADGAVLVRGLDRERIPELVSAIVASGARVYAVESQHESLEERFLSLLGQ